MHTYMYSAAAEGRRRRAVADDGGVCSSERAVGLGFRVQGLGFRRSVWRRWASKRRWCVQKIIHVPLNLIILYDYTCSSNHIIRISLNFISSL